MKEGTTVYVRLYKDETPGPYILSTMRVSPVQVYTSSCNKSSTVYSLVIYGEGGEGHNTHYCSRLALYNDYQPNYQQVYRIILMFQIKRRCFVPLHQQIGKLLNN